MKQKNTVHRKKRRQLRERINRWSAKIISIVMLILSAIALTTATAAWFTYSFVYNKASGAVMSVADCDNLKVAIHQGGADIEDLQMYAYNPESIVISMNMPIFEYVESYSGSEAVIYETDATTQQQNSGQDAVYVEEDEYTTETETSSTREHSTKDAVYVEEDEYEIEESRTEDASARTMDAVFVEDVEYEIEESRTEDASARTMDAVFLEEDEYDVEVVESNETQIRDWNAVFVEDDELEIETVENVEQPVGQGMQPGENGSVTEQAQPGENGSVTEQVAQVGENGSVMEQVAQPGENGSIAEQGIQPDENTSVTESDAQSDEKEGTTERDVQSDEKEDATAQQRAYEFTHQLPVAESTGKATVRDYVEAAAKSRIAGLSARNLRWYGDGGSGTTGTGSGTGSGTGNGRQVTTEVKQKSKLAPGVYGELTLYLTPLNMEINRYRIKPEVLLTYADGSQDVMLDNWELGLMDSDGQMIADAAAHEVNVMNSQSGFRVAALRKLVKGHILFFETREPLLDNWGDPVIDSNGKQVFEYKDPLVKMENGEYELKVQEDRLYFNSGTHSGTERKVTLYWYWPYEYKDLPSDIRQEIEVGSGSYDDYFFTTGGNMDSRSQQYDFADTQIGTYIKSMHMHLKVDGYQYQYGD